MAKQVANGKGFEWAVASRLSSRLEIPISTDQASRTAKDSYETLPVSKRELFDNHAERAVDYLLLLESDAIAHSFPELVWIATDNVGKLSDVRDVLVGQRRPGSTKAKALFGISCKTNHAAYKHSRLSGTLDWVREWGLAAEGASDQYWDDVSPIFARLKQLSTENPSLKWDEAFSENEKVIQIYQPILDAWHREVVRLQKSRALSSVFASLIFQAMLGAHSYYKVISRERKDLVTIQGFNFNNDLATPSTKIPSKLVHSSPHLPIGQAPELWNSINLYFDRGFTLNFRIHNGSSRVEPSLKFDVTGISVPPEDLFQTNLLPLRKI